MKRITKVVIGLVVVVGIGAFFSYKAKQAANAPTLVKLETVASRDLFAVVLASGKIDAKSRADVSSEVTGRILKIHVREGDVVKRGQLLVELDTVQYVAAVERATAQILSGESQVAQARTNRDQAKRNLDRTLELQRTAPAGAVTAEQVEQLQQAYANANASLSSSEAQLQQTRASLKEAKDNLGRTKLYAPISGRVVRLAVEEGEVAQPGTFSRDVGMLMRIADLSVVQAKVKVDETNLVRLALGDSVSVSIDAFPDTAFVGRVTKIANSAVSTTGGTDQAVNFEVEVTITNPPVDVRPDLSMTARIVTDVRKQVLSIPIIALTARADEPKMTEAGAGSSEIPVSAAPAAAGATGPDSAAKGPAKEKEGVFVVSNGIARFRPVKVGITGDEYFEVLDGLKAGDSVVSGTFQVIRNLKDSTRVRVDSMGAMSAPVKKP